MVLKAIVIYCLIMITEQQKYMSGIFRNVAFATLAPIASMIFQYLVFDKIFSLDKVLICLTISSLSYFLFFLSYNEIKEKKNAK